MSNYNRIIIRLYNMADYLLEKEKSDKPVIIIVVPCYNEEEVLPHTSKQLFIKIQNLVSTDTISHKSKIVFVDDGSSDGTWAIIEKYFADNPKYYAGIKLTKNSGHQNTLLCGLLSVKEIADAVISIDADLQDDINAIDEMISKYLAGCEIVYGIRSNRQKDTFFKKITAQGFYRFMRFLGVNILYNHADFRLMSRKALESLAEYCEVNLFLRGIVPLLGYNTDFVYYSREERFAGTSKYPLGKMLHFAIEGITSFSIKPMRLVTLLGVFLFIASISMIVYFFIRHFSGHAIVGWASIACSIWGIGGLILLSIGILGEYIGKIYIETKRRPRYHIEKFLIEQRNV